MADTDQPKDLEQRRDELLEQAESLANVATIFRRYQRIAAHAPAPVMVTTSEVRYSTGGNA
jgi:hypothetical protein